MKKGFILGVFLTLFVFLVFGGAYYLGTKSKSNQNQPATTQVTETIITPTPQVQKVEPTLEVKESEIPEEWLTYENEEYGFEISYPSSYEALDDEESLYGWPNAVVLIYGGGQSYDLPIEVWDTEAEYETKYPNSEELIVEQVGTKFITLVNVNSEAEVDEIIQTFKTVN